MDADKPHRDVEGKNLAIVRGLIARNPNFRNLLTKHNIDLSKASMEGPLTVRMVARSPEDHEYLRRRKLKHGDICIADGLEASPNLLAFALYNKRSAEFCLYSARYCEPVNLHICDEWEFNQRESGPNVYIYSFIDVKKKERLLLEED